MHTFHKLAREVANKIKSSGYNPDIIIGLARWVWGKFRPLFYPL